jgi:hypothetical protein
MLRIQFRILCLITVCGATGCAAPAPPKIEAAPASVPTATILSIRTVTTYASDGPLRAALPADAGPARPSSGLTEFIVRTDEGAMLSIVQANEAGFRSGDRVVILRDGTTRLARPN